MDGNGTIIINGINYPDEMAKMKEVEIKLNNEITRLRTEVEREISRADTAMECAEIIKSKLEQEEQDLAAERSKREEAEKALETERRALELACEYMEKHFPYYETPAYFRAQAKKEKDNG